MLLILVISGRYPVQAVAAVPIETAGGVHDAQALTAETGYGSFGTLFLSGDARLEEAGFLRPAPTTTGPLGGRPAKRWPVNPAVRK